MRVGKVEPEGRPARSGLSFSKVQKTSLPEGLTFPILNNDPRLLTSIFLAYHIQLIELLTPLLDVFTRLL